MKCFHGSLIFSLSFRDSSSSRFEIKHELAQSVPVGTGPPFNLSYQVGSPYPNQVLNNILHNESENRFSCTVHLNKINISFGRLRCFC